MIPFLSLQALTQVHVILSLIGIAAGIGALVGLAGGRWSSLWMSVFLITTVATTLTGFLFPIAGVTPALILGAASTLVSLVVLYALAVGRLAGVWRPVFVIGATIAQWMNAFVGVVQAFQKLPVLHQLAPNGSEPAFQITQGVLLVLMIGLGVLATRGFRAAVRP